MNDSEIKDFFHNHRPAVGNDVQFGTDLGKKMETMEVVKRYYDKALRHYRRVTWTVVLSVLVAGAALSIMLLSHTLALPHIHIDNLIRLRTIFDEWSPLFFILLSLCAITFGIMPAHDDSAG